jgi:hypothetical protein
MPDDLRWLRRELALELSIFGERHRLLGRLHYLCVEHPCEEVGMRSEEVVEPSELVRELYSRGGEPCPRGVTLSLLGRHPYERRELPCPWVGMPDVFGQRPCSWGRMLYAFRQEPCLRVQEPCPYRWVPEAKAGMPHP